MLDFYAWLSYCPLHFELSFTCLKANMDRPIRIKL